jgi:hypothetical protein
MLLSARGFSVTGNVWKTLGRMHLANHPPGGSHACKCPEERSKKFRVAGIIANDTRIFRHIRPKVFHTFPVGLKPLNP